MERIKDKSLLIAGIMFVVMAVFKLFYNDAYSDYEGFYYFFNCVITVGFLALGILCIKGGLEPAKAVILAVLAVFYIFLAVYNVFQMITCIVDYFNFTTLIFYIIYILEDVLDAVALAALAFMTFSSWKKKTSILDRFWFGPAVIAIIPAVLCIVRLIINCIFTYSFERLFTFDYLTNGVILPIIGIVIYAVMLAFYGLGSSNKSKAEDDGNSF